MTTVVLNTTTKEIEVFSSARDVQARTEIADHKAAADPHPQYLADVDAADIATSGSAADLIAGIVPDGRMPGWTGYTAASKAALEAANVPPAVGALNLLGYSAAGDGGGASYRRVGSEPSHPGKIQSADGAWWEIAENVINVRQFGAVGDCTGPDTGTDDSAAFQAAVDWWKAKPLATLIVPDGRFRLASAIEVNLGHQKGHRLFMEGWVTPDTTVARAFLFHDGTEAEFVLRVLGGGTTGDLSAATPTGGGTECFIFRGIRRATIKVRAHAYAGRVLKTEKDLAGEFKTSDLDIFAMSGERPAIGDGDIGQILFADGGDQGNWGWFSWDGEGNEFGPTWEDCFDIHIGTIECGRLRQQGIEFRSVKGVIIGNIYVGEGNAGTTANWAVRILNTGVVAPQRISINQFRALSCAGGLYVQGGAGVPPTIYVGHASGNNVNPNPLVHLDGARHAHINAIEGISLATALQLSGTVRDVHARVSASGFSDDALIIGSDCDRVTITGNLRTGSVGKSLVTYAGTSANRVTLRDMWLDSGDVDQLIHIATTGPNALRLIGGGVSAAGGVDVFTSGRRPLLIKDASGHPTYSYGSATILSGNTSVVVNHGLARIPGNVKITPRHAEVADAIVTSAIDDTTFTISVESAVMADRSLMWEAAAELT